MTCEACFGLLCNPTAGTDWGRSFSYDGFGNVVNMLVTKGLGSSTCPYPDPTNNRLGSGYQWDASGNMAARSGTPTLNLTYHAVTGDSTSGELSSMKLGLVLFCVASVLKAVAYGQGPTPLLDKEDVWLLVMNIPDVIELEARRGCPHLEFTPVGKDRMWVQVRNGCPKSGNGMIGNYTVDLRDGDIWYDVDPIKFIDTERLQRLRKVLALAAAVAYTAPSWQVMVAW